MRLCLNIFLALLNYLFTSADCIFQKARGDEISQSMEPSAFLPPPSPAAPSALLTVDVAATSSSSTPLDLEGCPSCFMRPGVAPRANSSMYLEAETASSSIKPDVHATDTLVVRSDEQATAFVSLTPNMTPILRNYPFLKVLTTWL